MNAIKEIMEKYGFNIKQLSDRFGIPYRTVQNWANGSRTCPDYIPKMILEILEKEGKKMFTIQNRETGTKIETVETEQEALAKIEEYEKEDLKDGCFEENFYEIVEE